MIWDVFLLISYMVWLCVLEDCLVSLSISFLAWLYTLQDELAFLLIYIAWWCIIGRRWNRSSWNLSEAVLKNMFCTNKLHVFTQIPGDWFNINKTDTVSCWPFGSPGSDSRNDPITADNVIGSVISRQLMITRSNRISRTIVLRSDHDPSDPACYVDPC